MQVLSQQISPGEKRDSAFLARRNFPRPAKNATQYPVLQKNQNFEELPPTNLNTS
jgi:hypothetical protein